MNCTKRVMAILLVVMMLLSGVVFASAAGSPTTAPETEVTNPGYDTENNIDVNSQDHTNNIVTSRLTETNVTTFNVKVTTTKKTTAVVFNIARDKDNNKVDITDIGDGKKGIFNSKSGRRATSVIVKSKAKKVTIHANAFKGSKVKKVTVTSKKLTINKNSFKGTKVKNPTLIINGPKKASAISVKKGSFNGLSNKAKIIVKKGSMTRKEFNALKKKLVKAGFKGKIVYQ